MTYLARASRTSPYFLLPFRFHPINESREVLVNEVGDFLLCPRGTAQKLAERQVTKEDPLYADLCANFFISDSPIPPLLDVISTRYRTKKAFLDSFTALHIIVLTLRCNHSCHYCQVSRQTKDKLQYDISTENLDRSLDLIFRSPAADLTIEFQGGEPGLAFDRLRYAVAGALARNERYHKALRFVLCTNLTVMTNEMLAYCRQFSVLLSTSLDGPPELHDKNRPIGRGSSYALLVDGLKRARAVLGHDRVSALMTTSRPALEQPEAIVDAYVDNEFEHIFLRPIHPYGFAARLGHDLRYGPADFLAFFKRALLYMIQLNGSGTRIVEDYTTIVLKKMLTPFGGGFVDLQSPAGLVNSVVVYNYDGRVFASDESRMLAETGDVTFKLGNVSDPYEELFYGPRARYFTEASVNESLAGCSDCGFQAYCGADPVRNHSELGDIVGYRPLSSHCSIHMEICRFLLELLDSDPAAERVLRSWASS